MNLHWKPTAIYRPFDLPLNFHLPERICKSIGWEPVTNTNRNMTLKEVRKIRWSCSFYADSDDCS